MTFRAERYPKDWKAISAAVMARAGDRCECKGECGSPHDNGPSVGDGRDRARCCAPNGEMIVRDPRRPWVWWPQDGSPYSYEERPRSVKVILTAAHLDHDETNNDPSNLLACCQRCHLKLDARDNRARRAVSRALEHPSLPGLAPVYRRGVA